MRTVIMDRDLEHNQQILDEAAEWFVNFREGDLDAKSKAHFSRWLRRSPEHIAAYLEIAAFWEDVPNILSRDNLDIEELISMARNEANIVLLGKATRCGASTTGVPAAQTRRESRIADRIFVIAACVVACIGGAGIAWRQLHQGVYTTDVGEQRLITLDDGTTVELNVRTRLRVQLEPHVRNVALLEGQALFHVAKDTARPFIVQSGGTSVRAVGTQFDVYKRESGATVVTVVAGRVAVSSSDNSISITDSGDVAQSNAASFLSAGERIIVTAQHVLRQPEVADVSVATAWTQHQMVFQGTPLSEVVEEFNRYNRHQLVIEDSTLQSIRLSGVFASTDPASLIRFLRGQLQLPAKDEDGKIAIGRR
jgi:transmembrane sensor